MKLIGLFPEYWRLVAELEEARREIERLSSAYAAANDRLLAAERRADDLQARLDAAIARERELYDRAMSPTHRVYDGEPIKGRIRAHRLVSEANQRFALQLAERLSHGTD